MGSALSSVSMMMNKENLKEGWRGYLHREQFDTNHRICDRYGFVGLKDLSVRNHPRASLYAAKVSTVLAVRPPVHRSMFTFHRYNGVIQEALVEADPTSYSPLTVDTSHGQTPMKKIERDGDQLRATKAVAAGCTQAEEFHACNWHALPVEVESVAAVRCKDRRKHDLQSSRKAEIELRRARTRYLQAANVKWACRNEEKMKRLLRIWSAKYGPEQARAMMSAKIRKAGMERYVSVKNKQN